MAIWSSDRAQWFIPLFGGAEMNRIKIPQRRMLTSMPYPVLVDDTLTPGFDTLRLRIPPSATWEDRQTHLFGVQLIALSRPIGDQTLDMETHSGTVSFGTLEMSLSRPIGDQTYTVEPVPATIKFGVEGISLKVVLVYYDLDTDHSTVQFNVEGIHLS